MDKSQWRLQAGQLPAAFSQPKKHSHPVWTHSDLFAGFQNCSALILQDYCCQHIHDVRTTWDQVGHKSKCNTCAALVHQLWASCQGLAVTSVFFHVLVLMFVAPVGSASPPSVCLWIPVLLWRCHSPAAPDHLSHLLPVYSTVLETHNSPRVFRALLIPCASCYPVLLLFHSPCCMPAMPELLVFCFFFFLKSWIN